MTDVCRVCKKPIAWAQTVAGYPIALEAEPHKKGNLRLEPGRNGQKVAIAVPAAQRSKHKGELFVSHLCEWGRRR